MRKSAAAVPLVLGLLASNSVSGTRGELETCEDERIPRPSVTCHSFNWEGISCAVAGDVCEGERGRCQVGFGLGILRRCVAMAL